MKTTLKSGMISSSHRLKPHFNLAKLHVTIQGYSRISNYNIVIVMLLFIYLFETLSKHAKSFKIIVSEN